MALDTNLTAFWKMNEPLDYMPCEDSVGSNTLVSYNDPTVIDGIRLSGRALDEDDEHYLGAPDHADLSMGSTDLTILMWFRGQSNFGVGKSNLSSVHNTEYGLWVSSRIRNGWVGEVGFSVNDNDSPYQDHSFARLSIDDIWTQRSHQAKWESDIWYMALARWNDTTDTARIDLWQGVTTSGIMPEQLRLWDEDSLGNHSSGRSYPGGAGFGGAYDGTGTLNIGRHEGNAGAVYDSAVGIDCIGIWKRELTNAEGVQLWNKGQGLEYPFFIPTTMQYYRPPGPVIHPKPHVLYGGATWDVGETPVRAPAPAAGWMSQTTLPAWRVKPRIQGWSYGNNFPLPAPVPLVSEWWGQASEPVDDSVQRHQRMVSSMGTPMHQEIFVPPVIPDPPLPPEPPIVDSEAITDDEAYRPGRADEDSDRYRK